MNIFLVVTSAGTQTYSCLLDSDLQNARIIYEKCRDCEDIDKTPAGSSRDGSQDAYTHVSSSDDTLGTLLS